MSRTYRKTSTENDEALYHEYYKQLVHYDWQTYYWAYRYVRLPVEPSKKAKAIHRRDGKHKKAETKSFMKMVSRVRRANDRTQLANVFKYDDYDDYYFDDSHAVKYRKGIWWAIY